MPLESTDRHFRLLLLPVFVRQHKKVWVGMNEKVRVGEEKERVRKRERKRERESESERERHVWRFKCEEKIMSIQKNDLGMCFQTLSHYRGRE